MGERRNHNMTLRDCFASIQGDYEGLMSRVMTEKLAERLVLKFLEDPNFGQLVEGIEQEDYEKAFRGAHTLKGVCASLGFTRLQEVSSQFTEELRGREKPEHMELLELVRQEYDRVCIALRSYRESNGL